MNSVMYFSSKPADFKFYAICLIKESYNFLYFFTGRGEIWGMFSIDRKYMLLGGVMGAFITWTVIKSMDGLGPAKATLLIVVTQILVSYIAEVFGLFGVEKAAFEWRKLIGAALAIAGIVVFRW